MKRYPRIIFMGTPEFAVPSLEALLQAGYPVVAVVTATDKLGGRGGKQLLQSAVKQYAVSQGIPVLQPEKLRSEAFLAELRSYQADLQIVVAFRMLPEVVWAMPPLGTFNLHGSLLPKYRGAAPINWAIINGDLETGVTTFFLQHEIDTGNILLQAKAPIYEEDCAGDVHDRMMVLGAKVVVDTVEGIVNNSLSPTPQDDMEASPAPKIFHDTCHINFNRPTRSVHDFIRGLSPYPGAWAVLEGEEWKILLATPLFKKPTQPPGTLVFGDEYTLYVATTDGYVQLLQVQMAGKRRMSTKELLLGWRANESKNLSFS